MEDNELREAFLSIQFGENPCNTANQAQQCVEVFKHFANSKDKIKVAEDGITEFPNPRNFDEFGAIIGEGKRFEELYDRYDKAESITIQEHNKRLIEKIKAWESVYKFDIKKANERIKQLENERDI